MMVTSHRVIIDTKTLLHPDQGVFHMTLIVKHTGVRRSRRNSQMLGMVLTFAFVLGPEYALGQVSNLNCPQNRTPPPGLVAWWPLNEGAGATSIADVAPGNVNNGTPVPSPIAASQSVPG